MHLLTRIVTMTDLLALAVPAVTLGTTTPT
jgi:hypothetical protein